MAMNNTYINYKELVTREGRKSLLMGKVVKELVHSLCQQGSLIQNQAATHLAHLRDMDQVDVHLIGIKI
jgi:hypothetical protein